MARLAIKIDVDTERGTRVGVPALQRLFAAHGVPATFYFSLGPDNTGRAIRRVFRRGFLGKVQRTSVVSTYGLRTLANGVLWPGPNIARRHGALMRAVRDAGFEVGIHCHDHVRWQDGLAGMTRAEVDAELGRARAAFEDVFGFPARTAAAAGWQADAHSLAAYDAAGFDYASDSRGTTPFFPSVAGRRFATLQIPTTLPTLDELLGRPEYPVDGLVSHYLSELAPGRLNVLTAHAEIEGMRMRDWFDGFLGALKAAGVAIVSLGGEADRLLAAPDAIPVMALRQGEVAGRSGTLAVQGSGSDAGSPPMQAAAS